MIERLSFNAAVNITGILGLLFILCSFFEKSAFEIPKNRRLFSMLLLLVGLLGTDLVSIVFRGKAQLVGLLYFSNTATFVLSYLMLCAFVEYLELDLGIKKNEWKLGPLIIYVISAIMILALLFNPVHRQFFVIPTDTGLYRRQGWYPVITISSLNILGICLLEILFRRGVHWRKRLSLMCYCFCPVLAVIIQHFFYGLSLSNMGALASALIIYTNNYAEQNSAIAKKELELQNTRSALILSQIQPHFLFNSMTTVMNLCDTDPQEAKAALQELSDFLHYKISALSNSYVVSFSEDLEFLQNYLKLEKRRYGDRLHVEYDIQCDDFQIPLLTLQPLIENAIRHGINRRPGGGTIRIATRAAEHCRTITISDNGVGFDTSRVPIQDIEHVGLSSVRKRLDALCDGRISISSSPEVGTTVEITITKGIGGNEL